MTNAANLSSGLTASAAVDGIFGAVRDRVDVRCRAMDRIAGRDRERRAKQADGEYLLKHAYSPPRYPSNADVQEGVHYANVIRGPTGGV